MVVKEKERLPWVEIGFPVVAESAVMPLGMVVETIMVVVAPTAEVETESVVAAVGLMAAA